MTEGNTIDWKNLKKRAEDATKPPEPGWYTLECTKADLKTNSSGNPMIVGQFKIVEGPAAGKTGIFNNFNFSPDSDFALAMFFRQMAGFGFNDAFFNSNPSFESIAQQIVGRRASVKLGIRSYQGQDRANFEEIKPVSGAQAPLTSPVAGPSVTIPSVTAPSNISVPSATAPPSLPI